jgi:DNA repair protein RecO (recombination protein O)
MCGFYLNELLLRLLPRDDPHETLFDCYAEALNRLSLSGDASAVLRAFEKRLLAELGYAPILERDAASRPIDPERLYAYEPERGPTVVNGTRGDLPVVRGRTLLDVAADDYSDPQTREEARNLMRALIGERLHGQVLHTRTVLRELSDL